MRICLLLWACLLTALFSPARAQSSITTSAQLPSFFYQGDQPLLQFLLINNSRIEQTGNLQLELFDGVKNQSVDGWFYNQLANQYFTLTAGERYNARFPVSIPHSLQGTIVWQLTLRIDSTKQILRGSFETKSAPLADTLITEDTTIAKGSIRLFWKKGGPTSNGAVENPITPYSTQPMGQTAVIRMNIAVYQKLDSCIVQLPLSAGLYPLSDRVITRRGKPTSIVTHTKNDSMMSMTLYGLAPGLYQWDYLFNMQYPGQFLIPSCRMQLFNATRKELFTISNTINIE